MLALFGALTAAWLMAPAVTSADGGLLDGVLSSSQGSEEEDGESGLLGGVIEGVGETAKAVTNAAGSVTESLSEPDEAGADQKSLEPMLSATEDVADSALSEPVDTLLTVVDSTVQPVLTTTDDVIEAATDALAPAVAAVDALLEPIEPLLQGVVEPLTAALEPVLTLTGETLDGLTDSGLAPAAPAPAAEDTGSIETPGVDGAVSQPVTDEAASIAELSSIRTEIDGGNQTPPPQPASPLANPDYVTTASGPYPPGQAGHLAEEQPGLATPGADGPKESAGDAANGPLARLSALLTSERGGSTSIGALSAVLASLAALFIAPALAARALVAMPAPRSPVYLPVHPPD